MTSPWMRRLCRFVAATVLVGVFLARPAGAQGSGESAPANANPLAEGQSLYEHGKFAEGYFVLKNGIASGKLSAAEGIRAREFLARCLVKAGNSAEARTTFKELMRLDASYRADPALIPPDEMEVYRQALAEFLAAEVREGRRVPASVGMLYGLGNAANKDFGSLAAAKGGASEFDASPEFGGSVRFPIRPRWSVDLELSRLRATDTDGLPVGDYEHKSYEASAFPLVASVTYIALPGSRFRGNVFVGAGPLLAAQAEIQFLHDHGARGVIPVSLSARNTSLYAHAGIEGELLVTPKLAISGRVVGRYARSSELDFRQPTFLVYEDVPTSDLQGKRIDFSGVGVALGLRTYIGYQAPSAHEIPR
jgi:hypothetical protein